MNFPALALSFILLSGQARAAGDLLKCTDDQAVQVSNKTKLLKTYTREYWQIATAEIKTLPLALQKTGFVTGDLHFNNAGIYYDYEHNRAEFQLIDFDDSGKNFLIADFFKFLTYVRKLDKSTDQFSLLNAYAEGLAGHSRTEPSEIASVLNRPQYDFNKDSRKYIENQRSEISAFDKSTLTNSARQIIERLKQLPAISRLQNLDYMVQVNDSGSSANAARFQFIGTDSNFVTGVIEFKQMKCSATGPSGFQNVSGNFEDAKKFMKEFAPSSEVHHQYIFKLDEDNYFLVREKKRNFLKKVDLENLPLARLSEVASYYANYLGRLHAGSSDGAYRSAVTSQSGLLIEKAKVIAKKFKDKVKD